MDCFEIVPNRHFITVLNKCLDHDFWTVTVHGYQNMCSRWQIVPRHRSSNSKTPLLHRWWPTAIDHQAELFSRAIRTGRCEKSPPAVVGFRRSGRGGGGGGGVYWSRPINYIEALCVGWLAHGLQIGVHILMRWQGGVDWGGLGRWNVRVGMIGCRSVEMWWWQGWGVRVTE